VNTAEGTLALIKFTTVDLGSFYSSTTDRKNMEEKEQQSSSPTAATM